MIHSVFHFGDRVARELMVPRPDVVAIDLDQATIREAHALAVEKGFTRMPAYRGTIDQTEGIVHAKDLLAALLESRPTTDLAALMRPVHFVPDSKRAADLLREMQKQRFHAAMVIDEYGTVVGMVTLENLIEELVGDIAEEHEHEVPDVTALGDGAYRLDATVTLTEMNELLGTAFPDDRWNTVGGLMFGVLGTIPKEGEEVSLDGYRFTAERVRGRRVALVRVTPDPGRLATAAGDDS
jgi:CBS domain containing-hemolysin-like protein